MINLGADEVSRLHLGGAEVSRAHVGADLVFGGGGVTPDQAFANAVSASSPLASRNLTLTAESFDGATSYPLGDSSVVAAIVTSDKFTLEGIVSLDSLASDGTVIGLFSTSERQCLLWFDEGDTPNFRGIFRTASDTNGALTPSSPSGYSVATGTEYHVVYCYNGADGRLYVNGVLVETIAETSSVRSPGGGYEVGDDTGNARFLTGTGRGFAIYDRAISATEVTSHFNASGI